MKYNNDRFISENIFIKSVKQLDFCKENIDEVILRAIKFKLNKNKIYVYDIKEETKDE